MFPRKEPAKNHWCGVLHINEGSSLHFISRRDDGCSLNLLRSSFHDVCHSSHYAIHLKLIQCWYQSHLNKTRRKKKQEAKVKGGGSSENGVARFIPFGC